MLDQVLAVALRPFLARCADVWMTRLDPAGWNRPWCLLCGGEPEFAVLPSGGDRWLICGRCTAQWPFSTACPFCGNDAPGGITSFASRDGRYRVYGCNDVPEVPEGVRCARHWAPGDAGGRHDRYAAARRGGHSAGV